LICVWVRFGPTVIGAGQFNTAVEAAVTVKVLVQVVIAAPQLLLAVKVTLTEPPQALGAATALLLTVALHPPVTVAKANQALNLVLIWACVWQLASVLSVGQFSTRIGEAITANVLVILIGVAEQLEVAVKVTSLLPPQAEGAPVLLLDNTTPHPPVVVAEASHAAYLASIAACVWQAASDWFVGAFKTSGEFATVKVAWQVVVNGAQVLV
jgi:hypothetical protein